MADTRNAAVWGWLMTCPHIKDMFFNFSQSENGDTVLVPLTAYKDTENHAFIDGSAECYYDFTLIRFDAVTFEPNSTTNIEVLANFESIAAWIEAQEDVKNYPAFPAKHSIIGIETLPSNAGYVAARDETGVKYMLQFRINYIKED